MHEYMHYARGPAAPWQGPFNKNPEHSRIQNVHSSPENSVSQHPLTREEKAEQLAKAEKARLAELERIRSLPLNRATLESGMDYIYFADGSCKESKSEQCLTLSQYRQMCGFNEGLTKGIRKVLGVFYNGPYSNFLETGGTMGNIKVLWQDGEKRCTVSFTISGTFQGSSHSKDFLGAAQTFVVTPSKQVLIHGGNIHAIN